MSTSVPLNKYQRTIKLTGKIFRKLYNKFFENGFTSIYYEKNLIAFSGNNTPSKKAIGDHICTLFADLLILKPSLIVELGTRGGESTRAILAAANYFNGKVLSIDINPCGAINLPEIYKNNWEFIQADDIEFGQSQFIPWCESRNINASIDALFIDTSHEYEHTKKEIDLWLQYISLSGIVLFHDTNLHRNYRRLNNTIGHGWNNQRGVIRAIEDYFGKKFDETKTFVDINNNWLIRHYPYSSGFTMMKKLSANND